jgi:DNA-binding CsgD family transcriptional regulator
MPRPFRFARCRWREAEAHLTRGDRASAEAAAADALALASRLGARWLVEELCALARRGRLRVDTSAEITADAPTLSPTAAALLAALPADPVPPRLATAAPAATPTGAAGAGAGGTVRADLPAAAAPPVADASPDHLADLGLTPRERDVLALVAQGRTNRQIGEELFMAEKTASVHVSRILAKLDVRSRTEAAAVAHRLGLESPDDDAAPAVA